MTKEELQKIISEKLRFVSNFPKEGVNFIDLQSLLLAPGVLTEMAKKMSEIKCDAIVAIESRGFLFGAVVTSLTGSKLVLARKKGKLPPPVVSQSYALEYGTDTIEIEEGAVQPTDRVLIIDDVLATGGTLKAVGELLNKVGVTNDLISAYVFADIKDLHGELPFNYNTLITC